MGSNWKAKENCASNLQCTLDSILCYKDGFFPSFTGETDLVLACDYGSDNPKTKYLVQSFVLIDKSSVLQIFDPIRLLIRSEYFCDERRMAFSRLTSSKTQAGLIPFLKLVDMLNGIVFCVAVDKSLDKSDWGFPPLPEDFAVKPKYRVWSKMVRTSLLGSILISGLTSPDQKLIWITDDDQIVANQAITDLFCMALSNICFTITGAKEQISHVGIAGKFRDSHRAEDLCSIADLALGGFNEMLNSTNLARIPKANIYTPSTKRVSTKSLLINAWLADTSQPFKKLLCVISKETNGSLSVNFASPELRLGIPGVGNNLVVPLAKGWQKVISTEIFER